MREILFKAKRIDNGEWVEGYLYRLSEKQHPFIMLKDRVMRLMKIPSANTQGLPIRTGNQLPVPGMRCSGKRDKICRSCENFS